MARSRRVDWCLGVALGGLLASSTVNAAAAAAPAAGGGESKCTEPIDVKADSADLDYKSNTTQLKNVVISQCDIRVQAKRANATGVSFDNTRWIFEGDVHIDVEKRGNLRADRAIVDFANNQIARATITGSPAEFEQSRDDNLPVARGHAGEMVYDVGAGTVRFVNDAWLKYGTTEAHAASLVYNIRQENVQSLSQPGTGERVHIRITPTKPPEGKSGTPATPPPKSP